MRHVASVDFQDITSVWRLIVTELICAGSNEPDFIHHHNPHLTRHSPSKVGFIIFMALRAYYLCAG